jgi:hypothetical protein
MLTDMFGSNRELMQIKMASGYWLLASGCWRELVFSLLSLVFGFLKIFASGSWLLASGGSLGFGFFGYFNN